MSSDKRAVATDALDTLGTFITDKEKRDAIHLGVDPAIAGQLLNPGDHVFLANGKAFKAKRGKGIGIVDPFLIEEVEIDQRFWLVVYPRQITSLRHVWEHPSFPVSKEITANSSAIDGAIIAVKHIAENLGVSYEDLMLNADYYYDDGEYWVQGERFEGESVPESFWPHYSMIRGKTFRDTLGNFLDCSC